MNETGQSIKQKISISNDIEITSAFGSGPIQFWNELELGRPSTEYEIIVGDYEVCFTDKKTKIIAANIIINKTTIENEITIKNIENNQSLWFENFFDKKQKALQ